MQKMFVIVSGGGDTADIAWAFALPIISSGVFIAISTYISFHMTGYIEKLRLCLHPIQEINEEICPVSMSDGQNDSPTDELSATAQPTSANNNIVMSSDKSELEPEPEPPQDPAATSWDITLIRLLLLVAIIFTGIAHYVRTTFLLGAFMAGVAFSSVPGMHDSWSNHMPTVATWTARLFFASIGFTIPVRELFSIEALYFGLLLTFIAIASKVATGVFEWDDKWAIGWAMVGRGELGFVMAEEAYRNDLTSKLTYSVTVWALLLATLLSPIAFRRALSSHHHSPSASTSKSVTADGTGVDVIKSEVTEVELKVVTVGEGDESSL